MKGQVALIVLLISAVVMTIGLSLSKRTVITTSIETNQAQLKQAFDTAESGVDYYLGTGSTKFTAVDGNSSAEVQVTTLGGGSTINFNQYTTDLATVNFWMVGHLNDGSIDYTNYFGGTALKLCISNTASGALKIDYFSKTVANAARGHQFLARWTLFNRCHLSRLQGLSLA